MLVLPLHIHTLLKKLTFFLFFPKRTRIILKNAGSWGLCKSRSESKLDKMPENTRNGASQSQAVNIREV